MNHLFRMTVDTVAGGMAVLCFLTVITFNPSDDSDIQGFISAYKVIPEDSDTFLMSDRRECGE